MPQNSVDHWDQTYANKASEKLGWYESHPDTSLKLIAQCQLPAEARILIAGAGTSTLLDALLAQGYQGLIATDLSPVALSQLQARLGPTAQKVTWVVEDLRSGQALAPYQHQIDLWQDRAVLHFLIEEAERAAYLKLLKELLKPGGFVILACFAPGTAEKCSGLPVRQYSAADLAQWLGPEFKGLDQREEVYTMPSGDTRLFTYVRFQRVSDHV
ncbi:SAM-dependent methyltransferase [bacterium (Candidatus Blackallbacteria) CG17_big_fil_post_rev_8_21_14_2_50_48_46]|uniref:SAM-dependent methyltransferase n=1 Tax=bacterium (Candidatus Blackallbacteria) CG17_big_fil_post_rev_8_21_14_2_50_48_46 TaxID=2014261 RepID=A0A2M7G1F6_9BACT|nr:MAG: SAM-dependent methyltransferase [bacterium (Candidatus Blackallbacteria) CG18_big_fil_WC_8_21_14_2_50_49_26]PIW15367.1 MAG: SAM-dependent methyltransferase [bacterium (Candidatus Blackallbacteria) CG17_big_fil_post_rev_8_21_14_2_50_48_46]PIW49772.1 MAG: SAM-dependent methyltransferase [bacterium (Candidatus Blackallbacteria) CG13_big_fil_rev_8_21_14_2_50_49_14]